MIDWAKLKREWKTFALAVATTAVGTYDVLCSYATLYGYHYEVLIKEQYRMWVVPAVGLAFLALRKWKDKITTVETSTTTTVTEVTPVETDVSNK